MQRLRATVWAIIILGLLGAAAWLIMNIERLRPLDLKAPPDFLTGLHLQRLKMDAPRCLAVLDEGNVDAQPATSRTMQNGCGYDDAVVLRGDPVGYGGAVTLRCPAAAALVMWQRHVVAPAARQHLGTEVTTIRQLGTYSCRNINNRETGRRSQHATANAIDIAGFALANGDSVSLLRDWDDTGAKGRFLRAVRDGACPLFGAVLSPDYNALHADHFHFDMGLYSVCR
ncbi:extensin [Agaricicola taiwanensis]|uniref:Extensin n=1 Tax=Agaricicola taiwanensis TaxID=591372 RepID=A0A8J2VIX1_9RHOB|nr:extensin family protein [Agaricicola taiwanensis]GGE27737.1 extensin [Agaricicola taiwanensis]